MHGLKNMKNYFADVRLQMFPHTYGMQTNVECQDVFEAKRAVGESGKPLYQVKASEKGETTTVLPVFNATGTVGALMVIFKA